MMRPHIVLCLIAVLTALGCADLVTRDQVQYETVPAEPLRNTKRAILKNEQALHAIAKRNWTVAEGHLNTALAADVGYGPAHNNLGWVLFKQGRFYLAAWEFEYAARLMPDSGDPLNNLGLVFEEVRRLDQAITYFERANAADPNRSEFLANLARARVRHDRPSPELASLLSEVILRDERPEWREWASQLLETRFRDVQLACYVPSDSDTVPRSTPLIDDVEFPTHAPQSIELPIPSGNSAPVLPGLPRVPRPVGPLLPLAPSSKVIGPKAQDPAPSLPDEAEQEAAPAIDPPMREESEEPPADKRGSVGEVAVPIGQQEPDNFFTIPQWEAAE